jgi:hypothetical protein
MVKVRIRFILTFGVKLRIRVKFMARASEVMKGFRVRLGIRLWLRLRLGSY